MVFGTEVLLLEEGMPFIGRPNSLFAFDNFDSLTVFTGADDPNTAALAAALALECVASGGDRGPCGDTARLADDLAWWKVGVAILLYGAGVELVAFPESREVAAGKAATVLEPETEPFGTLPATELPFIWWWPLTAATAAASEGVLSE